MINVTKTYLPPFEEYTTVLKRAWDSGWITNNGSLVQELEQKLKQYLGVKNLLFTNNGTIVLQMALKALGITKEVITTPFSYVATTNAILWEGCQPVFVDINPQTFCIDADKIESAITENTQAILATHVYGIPCEVHKIAQIAARYNLKVIYDGAHAFGCIFEGKSLLSYGDISTCSFHATKIFHTVEGGCVITNNDETNQQLMLYRQFGHVYDEYFSIGVNGKNSEFHAAMGLCVLPRIDSFIQQRKDLTTKYNIAFSEFQLPLLPKEAEFNYGYYPIIFKSETQLLIIQAALKEKQINVRRYFYPSLNTLKYVSYVPMAISESISKRVLCLPLYQELSQAQIDDVIQTILVNA